MKTSTEILTEINSLREIIKEWKSQNLVIGFVPTMGALHIGHESLIKKAREQCDRVVVSIFVNPIQFGPNEDYDKYPRQIEADKKLCSKNNVDFIFAPTPQEIYPEADFEMKDLTKVVSPSSYQDKLCGKSRIGHFDGVTTIVLKLFNIVQSDKAYFGQKDAQQLIIIKKIVRDLNIPIEIIGCPIIRDTDGLACSSRNAYLSDSERITALTLSKVLRKVQDDYKAGITSRKEVINNALQFLSSEAELEYFEILDANNLKSIDLLKTNTLVAIAAKVGTVRLIDNLLI
ncbi:MAG: pantoate--beta-alanine ligase [bacterium]